MCSRWNNARVIGSAHRVASSLDLKKSITDISDIDIEFFENVLKILTGFACSEDSTILKRFQSCINNVSDVIEVPLLHIDPSELMAFNPNALGNFLEILEFLVDYSCKEQASNCTTPSKSPEDISVDILEETLSNCSIEEPHGPLMPFEIADFTFKAEDLIRHSEHSLTAESSSSNSPRCQGDGVAERHSEPTEPLLDDHSTDCSLSTITSQESSRSEARMTYLREKLRECLSDRIDDSQNSGNIPPNLFDSSKESDFSDESAIERNKPRRSPVNSHIKSRSPCVMVEPSGSFVRASAQPLIPLNRTASAARNRPCTHTIRPAHSSATKTAETDASVSSLLDKVLEAFPLMDLDENDRRVLRRKAVNALGAQSGRASVPAIEPEEYDQNERKITWYDERNRRRLAQFVRHEFQMDRLLEQRASEEADRRIREEARDRRRQLVRARKYYRQFVHEFRARKLAKLTEEEQVFRRFFNQLLTRERQHLMELQQLERDEKRKKDAIREQALVGLEHSHRMRMALVNDSIRRERDQRITRMREERIELNKQKHELRRLLELNINKMQQNFLSNQDGAYFRQADADRLLRDPHKSLF